MRSRCCTHSVAPPPSAQAYRDWGVELYDWQSQCSIRADQAGATLTHRKMMPTVGCEADAAAFTEEGQLLLAPGTPGATYAADGAYAVGPADLAGLDKAAFEHCLPVAPGKTRVRLLHHLKRLGAERRWKVMEVELHWERYDSPHTGRRELVGCGGGMDAIAQTPRLDAAEALGGAWSASGVVLTRSGGGEWAAAEAAGRPWDAGVLPSPPVGLVKGAFAAWSMDGESLALVAGVVREDGTVRLGSTRVVGGTRSQAELLTLMRA